MKEISKTEGIIVALLVLLIITTGFTAYFYQYNSGYRFDIDTESVNNIVTPIASIISMIVLGYIAYMQMTISKKQNDITQSHNKKNYLLGRFEKLKTKFNEPRCFPAFPSFPQFDHSRTIPVDPIGKIREVMSYLKKDRAFFNDQQAAIKSYPKKGLQYYMDQKYADQISYLEEFTYESLVGYELVKNFISEIKDSKLLQEDEVEIFALVNEEFVSSYITLIEQSKSDQTFLFIPFLHRAQIPDGEVSFDKVGTHPHFTQYYNFFKEHLYS